MKIAPVDLVHKSFGRKLGGFDPEEVLDYMKEIADQLESLISERNQLREQIRERDLQMLDYRERDKALKETLMTAHKMTEQLRKDAEREAALILNDAKQKAEAIVRDSRESLRNIYADIENLKKQKSQFEVGVRNLVTSHLELMERNLGYMPHVASPAAAELGGSTPNIRNGKPLLES